jgi:hypothetical protein
MEQFAVPYLETERGRNCALRKFLPDTVFWSAQFDMLAPESSSSSGTKVVTNGEVNDVITTQEGDSRCKEIKVGYRYSFFLTGLLKTILWKGTSVLAVTVFMILDIKSISPYEYFGLQ